ncbi:hypothetical protein EYZ11_003392 [Aspergillus tanneri]|uniref:Uncharacterized protein n=1 Tax=Aspergillus tanneri TaxID=1220188 RepID=A0A4S3JN93_9EURO|nr:uncharacterized protein ATNIH1004_010446 [Aspergillus tanneri]KAA8643672.1 hypothetical protein ATNIH1004_010446 [Aspergillus tanneri]THC97129.1 hypothetical protein EYZ11_003392 [Aspergillus tanneri]
MGGPRNVSHGRGGAGNIYSAETRTTPKDLVTPTIKQEVFTTGRGGSGNMMVNDPRHPEIARESQDVESPPLRMEDAPHHIGRGGAANAYVPSPEEERRIVREQEEQLRQVRSDAERRDENEKRDDSEKHAESSLS